MTHIPAWIHFCAYLSPISVQYVGRRQQRRISFPSRVKVNLKRAFRGGPESGACRRSCSSLEGEFRAQLQWKMNEIIDLSLWETVHEYRALTREARRDGNQDEKWGTRLKDCAAKEKEGGNSGESIKRLIERDDCWGWGGAGGGGVIRSRREKGPRWKGTNAKQMEREEEEEAERREDETASSLIGRLLMKIGGDWSPGPFGPFTSLHAESPEAHARTHARTHLDVLMWPLVCVLVYKLMQKWCLIIMQWLMIGAGGKKRTTLLET